jgi:hypothetical protein
VERGALYRRSNIYHESRQDTPAEFFGTTGGHSDGQAKEARDGAQGDVKTRQDSAEKGGEARSTQEGEEIAQKDKQEADDEGRP